MLDQNQMKKIAGEAAIKYIDDDMIIGVGTGTTIKYFIDKLATIKNRIQGTISSSNETTIILQSYGIRVLDLNSAPYVNLYVDGADEINHYFHMIKGGGSALTREKIIAAVAEKFICVADETKYVAKLGNFPLPVEVIPMARSYVARQIVKLGGMPVWREAVVTDNGNWILDVHNLDISKPCEMEAKINNIVGVVTNGLFANRPADNLLLACSDGNLKII